MIVRPKAGDIWEVARPGKRKIVKEVGTVRMVWMQREDGTHVRRPYAAWSRLNKGRYSGIRVKFLLKYGRRVSTKEERDAHLNAMIDRRKAAKKALEQLL